MEGQEFSLIQRLSGGDRATYTRVFNEFYPALCHFTHRFLDDAQASEDCAQEAFIALWDHRAEMASMAHVKAFLFHVCRNNALNMLKHERVRNDYYTSHREELESRVCFINYAIEEETERLLALTEQQLPPRCKEIFVLAMQGNENEEIAALLGISENTVKTQKKIAYKRLRENIAEMGMLVALLHW
jgi:RNA polymerase sigma-70 factor (ECF subfamily)